MAQVMMEIVNENKNKPVISIEEFKNIRKKCKERIREIFHNEHTAGYMDILADSFLIPAICENQKKDEEK